MAQNSLNLSVSGLYTATSELNGIPPGSLKVARNVESRHKNLIESRRGFEGLPGSAVINRYVARALNFPYNDLERVFVLLDNGSIFYYNESTDAYVTVPGLSTGVVNPNTLNAKSRLLRAGLNLYVTTNEGVRSLSQETNAAIVRAGVPKGLNLEAETNGDVSGFFDNNTVLNTIADTTSGAPTLSNLGSTTGVAIGQYVSGTNIPAATQVVSISSPAIVIAQDGDTTAGSATIANLASNAGIVAGLIVSGAGIPDGAQVVSISGGGPYSVVLTVPAYQTNTATPITFTTPTQITMSANATATATASSVGFYAGSQVGYRMVFGRVETNSNGISITRLGSPSSIALAVNIAQTSTNVEVTATLPKNASAEISFLQLYRSAQTDSVDITPLDQYNLVYERPLEPADFVARVVTVTDSLPDSLKGIPLYSGSDQEGILQSNDPPPSAWDISAFRNMMLYGNITRPSTVTFSILAVGAPDGVQIGDEITVSFDGNDYVFTGAASEDATTGEFEIVTGGTPSQNIADTTASLIRVMNFDESMAIHAISLSSSADLPGKILLECDIPSSTTFSVDADLHKAAYDPELDDLASELNQINNGLSISKLNELEAVPTTNLLRIGDSSSNIIRVVPLRDYVLVLKSDGVYKIQGTEPANLDVIPFDLTTKIIGADTAVTLNSAVWMLSNQGVVSISDGGVEAKSPPIDDKFNYLIGSAFNSLTEFSFAVGHESQRKYVLAVPDLEGQTFSPTQYVYNYVTSSWTSWDRDLHSMFVHSLEERLYLGRAGDFGFSGLSKERKTGTYTDYVDEEIDVAIVSVVSARVIELNDASLVNVGDILYQSSTIFSPITAVDDMTNEVTLQYSFSFTPGAAQILPAIETETTWNQETSGGPANTKQFSEGQFLLKKTRFFEATANFTTDFSFVRDEVPIVGVPLGGWGLFPWGEGAWGGVSEPFNIRFYVPQSAQFGSYIVPTLLIRQAYSDFQIQGISILNQNIGPEVGR